MLEDDPMSRRAMPVPARRHPALALYSAGGDACELRPECAYRNMHARIKDALGPAPALARHRPAVAVVASPLPPEVGDAMRCCEREQNR
jgi:hypothetical protein